METDKSLDAVALMRKLRAEVGEKLKGKSYEEQRAYLDEQVSFRKKESERVRSRRAV